MSTPLLPPTPSKNPASDGDLGAVLGHISKKLAQKHDGQLPAMIVSYNRTTNLAVVQPLISMIATSGNVTARAQLVRIPVLAYGGGGFFVNFPLVKGDLGWIAASDRDISLFLQSQGVSIPNSRRMHSFEDARFVPDVFAKYTFAPTAGAMVISSLDGLTRIEMSPGKIALIAPIVDMTESGVVNLPATTNVGGVPYPTHEHTGVQPGSGNTGGVV